MCGLVGVISNCSNGFTGKELDMFTDMLFLDTLRGFDSTGVVGVENNGSVVVHKQASDGLRFIAAKEFKEFRNEMIARGKFIMGHNRAATRGEVVDKNAHPFVIDDKIVLMQNGTYKGSHHHHKKTDVDTEAVAHVIAEHKEDDLETALQKINASYALAWYNAETYTLNLIRNTERPLFIAEFGAQGIVWASEAAFITFAADRAGIKLKAPPEQLEAGVHRTFKLDHKGSYVYDTNKLNINYKPSKHEVADDGVEWWNHGGMACGYSPMGQRVFSPGITRAVATAPKSEYSQGGVKSIDRDFLSCIINTNSTDSIFFDDVALNKEIERVAALRKNGYHYIELVDYFPANSNKDCEAFHVYGTLLDPEKTDESPQCLVHWIVYNKKEDEILQMVAKDTFFKVKLSGTNTRIVTIKQKRSMVLSAFAMEHEVMEISTEKAN